VLLVQSIPYAAAVVVSLASTLGLPGHWIGEAGADSTLATRHAAIPPAGQPSQNPAS